MHAIGRRPLLAVACLVSLTVVSACSNPFNKETGVPNPRTRSDESIINEATVVFVGNAWSLDQLESGEQRLVVEVTDVLKGDIGEVARLIASPETVLAAISTTDTGIWMATGTEPFRLIYEPGTSYPFGPDQLEEFRGYVAAEATAGS